MNRTTAIRLATVLLAFSLATLIGFADTYGNIRTNITATADTVINVVIPPNSAGRTCITKVRYTAQGTAHTLYAMRPLGETTVSSAAAASQKVINIKADPGDYSSTSATSDNALAANDWLVIQNDDGTCFADKVASITGLAVTMTTNLGAALSAGNKVWDFGVVGDTDPQNLLPHPSWPSLLAASTSTNLPISSADFLVVGHAASRPILLQSNNATAAGTFIEVCWKYVP
jgi:hypothetical protein